MSQLLILADLSESTRAIAAIVWLVVLLLLVVAFAFLFITVMRRMRKGQESAERMVELLESIDRRLEEMSLQDRR